MLLRRERTRQKRTIVRVLVLLVLVVLTSILVMDILFINFGPSMSNGTILSPDNVLAPNEYDDKTLWETTQKIDVFSPEFSEENVISGDGDKAIAPGTKRSHTFYVVNDFEDYLEYDITYTITFNDECYPIPLLVRLSVDNGEYLVGSKDSYGTIAELNSVVNSKVVGLNHYHFYVFEWYWPFESDNEYDTFLGNYADDRDLAINIDIEVVASPCEKTNEHGGYIMPSETNTQIAQIILGILGVCMLSLILIFGFSKVRHWYYDRRGI